MAFYNQLLRRKVRTITIAVVSCLIFLLLLREFSIENFDSIIPLEAGNESTEFVDGRCVLPVVDPFRADVMRLVRKLPAIKCNGKKRFGTVVGQELRLDVSGLRKAEMRYIRRPDGDDFNFKFSEAIPLDITTPDNGNQITIKPKEDFIKLYLTTNDGITETELHNLVIAKDDAIKRAKRTPGEVHGLQLNIAFVMLDSVSAAEFRRVMPRSLDVLKNQQHTIFFKGHTIVGDGTTAQICAMFTGINEQDLPEARRSFPDAQPVDRWPFIFKDFKSKGYVTMFQEDDTTYATFNYRLHGFKHPPTDHYARPFYLEASSEIDPKEAKCYGNWPIHQHVLSYTTSFADAYKDLKKLSLSIIARLPHSKFNMVQLMDEDLASFIRNFNKHGHMDNTMLVVFGDHGSRVSAIRSTIDGKLEERLPFLSITLPHWFKDKHRDLYNAMVANANVLTSHFDIYATLRHILTYPNFKRFGVGRSLFMPIKASTRNCKDAGVADHWCPCLNFVNVSVDDKIVQKASVAAVSFLNQLLSKNSIAREKCSTLTLKEIMRAGKVVHNWKMRDFVGTKGNSRCDSCLLLFKKNQEIPVVKYELVIKVSPSDGEFELNALVKGDEIEVDGNISRINLYGDQPDCIAQTYPHLRKYCFCE